MFSNSENRLSLYIITCIIDRVQLSRHSADRRTRYVYISCSNRARVGRFGETVKRVRVCVCRRGGVRQPDVYNVVFDIAVTL